MDIAAVEQSFGELLAALGDIVVARTRGAPADPAGGSTTALARRYRRRRRRFGELLAGVDDGALVGEDARAFANMRGSLDWIDPMEPTPGLPTTGIRRSALPAHRRSRTGHRPRPGGARPALW